MARGKREKPRNPKIAELLLKGLFKVLLAVVSKVAADLITTKFFDFLK